jgi:hypothetical protein
MHTSGIIPLREAPAARTQSYFERSEENPCRDCSAPCCRMVLIPHPTPTTFMDLDYIRYMVGFQSVKMILTSDGQWQVMVEQPCRLLDASTNLCSVHATPRQPKICVYFNPYQCWYKRNFTTATPPDIIRIDLDALDAILAHVRFDDDGNIVELPTYEAIRQLASETGSDEEKAPWFPLREDELQRRAAAMG